MPMFFIPRLAGAAPQLHVVVCRFFTYNEWLALIISSFMLLELLSSTE